MPHELVSYFLKNSNSTKCLQFRLVFGCAPFLKGVKSACAIRLETALCNELNSVLEKTGISYFYLSESQDDCLVFLYREVTFQKYLEVDEVREFLSHCGYVLWNVKDVLTKLRQNTLSYRNEKADFPHELGVILGYPVGDVKGFIENNGQNYILSGYWKVYGNLRQAHLTFGLYDYTRKCALNEYIMGESMNRIICMQQ